jgi:transposase
MSTLARVTIEPAPAEPAEVPKRRKYSIVEKRRIVEESFEHGASVARIARAHGVNANQVFTWRRQYQRGLLGGNAPSANAAALLPVTVAEAPPDPAPVPDSAPVPIPTPMPNGIIQLQLQRGRLRIKGAADPRSLRIVLDCLLG